MSEDKEATEAVWSAVRAAIDAGWPVLQLVGQCRRAWHKTKQEDFASDDRLWEKVLGDMKDELEGGE